MAVIKIPYGHEILTLEIEPEHLKAVLEQETKAAEKKAEQEIVLQALAEPVASPRLSELASKAHRVL
jgi:nickel-dependent lactate racemase